MANLPDHAITENNLRNRLGPLGKGGKNTIPNSLKNGTT